MMKKTLVAVSLLAAIGFAMPSFAKPKADKTAPAVESTTTEPAKPAETGDGKTEHQDKQKGETEHQDKHKGETAHKKANQ